MSLTITLCIVIGVMYLLLYKFFLLHSICDGATTRFDKLLVFFLMPGFIVIVVAADIWDWLFENPNES